MMSGAKLDVIWSPVHTDKFILWGTDITLYEVASLKDIEKKSTCIKISANTGATVLASQSAGGVRCIDVSYQTGLPDPLLALGHTSGRVSLTSLGQNIDSVDYVGQEFVPRYSRLCNSVSWSPSETNLLAAAMDKHRSDHCILLWDVSRGIGGAVGTEGSGSGSGAEAGRPLAEMGLSETAHSVSWTHGGARTLIASMNLRYIKIFDLRDLSNKAVATASSRHCYGAVADPRAPWQVASRGDCALCVWDTRHFDKPLLTLPQPRPLAKIQWCPTRRNLLCSLQRDSSCLRLHDIQQAHDAYSTTCTGPVGSTGSRHAADATSSPTTAVEADSPGDQVTSITVAMASSTISGGSGAGVAGVPGVVERVLSPGGQPLAGFCWHPERARVLAVTLSGSVVEWMVVERVTVAWGAGGGVAWAGGGGGGGGGGGSGGGGGGVLRILSDKLGAHLRDVSDTIRTRAATDYGLKVDLWQNAELAEDATLSTLWHFLALSRSLVEDGCIRNSPWRHPGVLSVTSPTALGGETGAAAGAAAGAGGGGGAGYRSEIVPSLLPDLPNRRITIYRSQWRQWALQMCGWGWGWEQGGAGSERAEAEGQHARAAALAVFHLRLRTALDVLGRAPQPALRVAALALAGLCDDRLWRSAAAAAATALPDPYLRAVLHFLCATAPTAPTAPAAAAALHTAQYLDRVLNETEMRLEDRVAFACIFLSDSKLHEYLQQLTDALVEQGDLSGILLTGMSELGVSLLQRWLDRSHDVQSAALLAARCLSPALLLDARAQLWVDSYRNLLDSWKMWWARCALDTWVAASGSGEAGAGAGAGGVARQVTVACGYCGKSVAAPPGHTRPRATVARLPPPTANMKQISSCPHCRKPLPRCAVCCLHMGTAAGAAGGAGGAGPGGVGAGGAGAQFGGWFTWCVTCRHGGHAQHLIDWFKEHTECPVSNCNCRCSSLDPPDRF